MHTRTWLFWLLAALIITGVSNNPPMLIITLLVATVVFAAWRDDRPLAQSFRLFFLLGGFVWVSYIVFSVITVGGARGQTIIASLPQVTLPALLGGLRLGGPIALEDVVWGAVRGLRLWVLMVLFGVFNALIDHYRLLRMVPRSFYHIGLAVTIALTFVPQTVLAIQETRDAQRLRGYRFRGVASGIALVGPVLASSLERSLQLAEALDARGYGRTITAGRVGAMQQVQAGGGILLLAVGLAAWLYTSEWALASGVAVAVGLALLGLSLRRLGLAVTRSIYRSERWRRRDTLVSGGAMLAAIGAVALRLAGAPVVYTPYPQVSVPPIVVPLLACVLLLALPAGVRPAPAPRTPPRLQRASRRASAAPVEEELTA